MSEAPCSCCIINSNDAGSWNYIPSITASFRIKDNTIIYKGKKDTQNWTVVALEGDSLHVDHMGAEMFFEKQR